MNLEKALNYLTHHIEPIIQWLFLAILVMCGFLIMRWLFGKNGDRAQSASSSAGVGAMAGAVTLADGTDIQTFLQKIMDQTAKLESLPLDKLASSGGGSINVGEVDAQVQNLKRELATREDEINKLKVGGDQKPGVEAEALATRIKELESKLAEYEILEDDIADLSLYKEENARLKVALEKSSAAANNSPSSDAPKADDMVAEFAEAVATEASGKAGPDLQLPETGDPMADFESAMKLEKKLTGGEAAPVQVQVAPAPIVTTAPVPTAAPVAVTEGDDLFAEFAVPAVDSENETALDTDKMMAEMANFAAAAPSTGGGLEEVSDIEKMALEATSLTKS